MEWYAVRHVIEDGGLFEERVTLWCTSSDDEAISRAEVEAGEYVATVGGRALDLFQCYRLSEAPRDGAEIFSLFRRSALPGDAYLYRFFDTGEEVQRTE